MEYVKDQRYILEVLAHPALESAFAIGDDDAHWERMVRVRFSEGALEASEDPRMVVSLFIPACFRTRGRSVTKGPERDCTDL